MVLNQADRHFAKLRQTMVDTQLRPNHITDAKIIEAFLTVPREQFVPKSSELVAYCDQGAVIGDKRYLLPPLTLATLFQHLNLNPNHKILVVGCGYGLTLALLKSMGIEHIYGIDNNFFVEQTVAKNLPAYEGSLPEGLPNKAPFDIVIIEGVVEAIPQTLLNQTNHKIACLMNQKNQITGRIFSKTKQIFAFDTAGYELTDFLQPEKFEFHAII